MIRQEVERSVRRTTGYVLWAYALLWFVAFLAVTPDGPAMDNSWPLWKDLASFLIYFVGAYLLISRAADRVNPVAFVVGRFNRGEPGR